MEEFCYEQIGLKRFEPKICMRPNLQTRFLNDLLSKVKGKYSKDMFPSETGSRKRQPLQEMNKFELQALWFYVNGRNVVVLHQSGTVFNYLDMFQTNGSTGLSIHSPRTSNQISHRNTVFQRQLYD